MELLSPSTPPRTSAAIVDALNQAISETAVTTMLAQNFHWNVSGMALDRYTIYFKKSTRTIFKRKMILPNVSKQLVATLRAHSQE